MNTKSAFIVVGLLTINSCDTIRKAHGESHSTANSYSFSNSSSLSWGAGAPQSQRIAERTRSNFTASNVPLLKAIDQVSMATGKPVYLSDAAARMLEGTQATCSIESDETSPSKLLRLVVAGTKLKVRTSDSGLQLSLDDERADVPTERTLSGVSVGKTLDQLVTLHMEAPLPHALHMIEGMAGVSVSYEGQDKSWIAGGPFVSVHADQVPVRKVLDDLAGQTGKTITVRRETVLGGQLDANEVFPGVNSY